MTSPAPALLLDTCSIINLSYCRPVASAFRSRYEGAASTTGLDLHRLKTQTSPEVGGASVGLVRAAPGGPAKALVDGLVVFAE
ncbi:MAG TPA: hypothetical protein VNF47_10390, partial [Streptosporangiaceae bacterium]|nr:hypothetical protein [Streptosporangiaceae bacterium]